MQESELLIRIVAPPRSGTNLVKYLIDTNTNVKGVFDLGWWKHALPNPMVFKQNKLKAYPTIIMFREVKSQLVSLYKLSLKGANSFIGDNDPNKFINSPVLMRLPDRSLEFFFPSPVDYLIQYYHAMLSLKDNDKFFIQLEDLISNPNIICNLIDKIYPGFKLKSSPTLPSSYFARNPDKEFNSTNCFDFSTTINLEKNISETIEKKLSFESKNLKMLNDLYCELMKSRVQIINQ